MSQSTHASQAGRPPDPSLPIECAGHPRDMGLAQGRALREAIRAEVARVGLSTRRSSWPTLRPLVSGPLRGHGAGRELFRHFAHQAERLEGLAQGADVPLDSLLELQLRLRTGDGGSGFFVRVSRPVVGFRSLELGWPWLVPAVAGVNEAGLAVVACPPGGPEGGASDAPSGAPSARAPSPRPRGGGDPALHRAGHAPPVLLVQDCLARFEDLAGALDWCRKRPVEGEQTLLLADASGARAAVVVSGRLRRIESGPLGDALQRPLDAGRGDRVVLDPVGRSLVVERAGAAGEADSLRFVLPDPSPERDAEGSGSRSG